MSMKNCVLIKSRYSTELIEFLRIFKRNEKFFEFLRILQHKLMSTRTMVCMFGSGTGSTKFFFLSKPILLEM